MHAHEISVNAEEAGVRKTMLTKHKKTQALILFSVQQTDSEQCEI